MSNSNYTISSASVIQRVAKTSDNQYGCVTVDKIPVDVPAFVIFGGELTNGDKGANSYAKIISTLLNQNGISGVNVYSVVYNFGSRDSTLERTELFKAAGRRLRQQVHPILQHEYDLTVRDMNQNEPLPNYIQQLYNIVLRPRVINDNGQKLELNTAMQNVRRMKFYAHCHGAAAIWQMANLMHTDMLNAGYTPADTNKVQHELLVIQHNPVAPLTHPRFSTVSFASAEDTMMQNHSNLFADWICENSADIIPCYFRPKYGNIFVAGHLKQLSFKEHDIMGLLPSDEKIYPLTDDGKIIFGAERNAIVNAAKDAISGNKVPSVKKLVDGKGINFNQLQENGDALYKLMLNDLRQQNLKRGYQK